MKFNPEALMMWGIIVGAPLFIVTALLVVVGWYATLIYLAWTMIKYFGG